MYHRGEVAEHAARAAILEDRAIHQAERGHFGKAAALEFRSDVQRAEALGAAMRPHYHGSAVAAGLALGSMVAAETAAVAGAVVRGAIVTEEIREAERIAASRYRDPYYAPTLGYVQPMSTVYPPGAMSAYPPGVNYPFSTAPAYPLGPAPSYNPGAVYPGTAPIYPTLPPGGSGMGYPPGYYQPF